MRPLVVGLSAMNLYLGTHYLLNSIGVLHTSENAPTFSATFAFLLLGLAAASIWSTFRGGRPKLALWLSVGPWALALAVMVFVMVSAHQ